MTVMARALAAYIDKMECSISRERELQILHRKMSKQHKVPSPRVEEKLDVGRYESLEVRLQNRPDIHVLRDRNIVRGESNVAGPLVANMVALKQEQLRSQLEDRIEVRPSPDDEVIQKLQRKQQNTESPKSLHSTASSDDEKFQKKVSPKYTRKVERLQKNAGEEELSQPESPKEHISKKIGHRPSRSELIDLNIIPSPDRVPRNRPKSTSGVLGSDGIGVHPVAFDNRLSGHWVTRNRRISQKW